MEFRAVGVYEQGKRAPCFSSSCPSYSVTLGGHHPSMRYGEVGGHLQVSDLLRTGVHGTSHLGTGDQARGSNGEAEAAGKETEEALEPR